MKEELEKLGLTENEATVYLALLDTGLTTAGSIIKKTKYHRNIVYFNLDRLIEKGLATFVMIKNIKHFQAAEADELTNYIEKQRQELEAKERLLKQVIPELEARRKITRQQEEATVYKGLKGVKNVLEDITRSKTELLLFATGWGAKQTLGSYYNQWHLKLKENNITGRALVSKKAKITEKLPYKVRYLDEEFIQPTTICVFEDKVLNIIWENEPLAVLITSEKNAESYRAYFEILWKKAKES
ncbi:hypothetical protein JXB28_06675 [Candidatus Woesearchaeota archaeon]|nr:hypothetical protein [Candidatus Woesearchaeota archaeon]